MSQSEEYAAKGIWYPWMPESDRSKAMSISAARCLDGCDTEFNKLALVPIEYKTIDRPSQHDAYALNRS